MASQTSSGKATHSEEGDSKCRSKTMLAGSVSFIVVLHTYDVASDIVQTVTYIELATIMASSVIGATMIGSAVYMAKGRWLMALLAIMHLHIPWLAWESFHAGSVLPELKAAKSVEGLLEAGPQALFQVYTIVRIMWEGTRCKDFFGSAPFDNNELWSHVAPSQMYFEGPEYVRFGKYPYQSDVKSLGVTGTEIPTDGMFAYIYPTAIDSNEAVLIVPQFNGGKDEDNDVDFVANLDELNGMQDWLQQGACSERNVFAGKGGDYKQMDWVFQRWDMNSGRRVNLLQVYFYKFANYPKVNAKMLCSTLGSLASLIFNLVQALAQFKKQNRTEVTLYYVMDLTTYSVPLLTFVATATSSVHTRAGAGLSAVLVIAPAYIVNVSIVRRFGRRASWHGIALVSFCATLLSPLMVVPSSTLHAPHRELLDARIYATTWFFTAVLILSFILYTQTYIATVLVLNPPLVCFLAYLYTRRKALLLCASRLQVFTGLGGTVWVGATAVLFRSVSFGIFSAAIFLSVVVNPRLQKVMGLPIVEKLEREGYSGKSDDVDRIRPKKTEKKKRDQLQKEIVDSSQPGPGLGLPQQYSHAPPPCAPVGGLGQQRPAPPPGHQWGPPLRSPVVAAPVHFQQEVAPQPLQLAAGAHAPAPTHAASSVGYQWSDGRADDLEAPTEKKTKKKKKKNSGQVQMQGTHSSRPGAPGMGPRPQQPQAPPPGAMVVGLGHQQPAPAPGHQWRAAPRPPLVAAPARRPGQMASQPLQQGAGPGWEVAPPSAAPHAASFVGCQQSAQPQLPPITVRTKKLIARE